MERRENWIQLPVWCIYILFIFYFIMFIAATLLMLMIVFDIYYVNNFIQKTFLCSTAAAFSGSTIYYIRKLYKHSIKGEISTVIENKIKSLGAFMYFFFRPFLSLVIGPFIVLIFYIFIYKLLVNCPPEESFFNLSTLFSFLGGFTTGQFVKAIQNQRIKIWNKLNDQL